MCGKLLLLLCSVGQSVSGLLFRLSYSPLFAFPASLDFFLFPKGPNTHTALHRMIKEKKRICTKIESSAQNLPSSPDSVNSSALSNIDNEIHVGVVVVVGSSWHLNILIGHADVFGVDLEILRCCHDGELDGTLVAKGLVRPLADGADLLDGSNTVVGDQDLCDDTVASMLADKVADRASSSVF